MRVRGGHIPDPRAAAGWSSVSTHTKRQVTLAALINEIGRRGPWVWGAGVRPGTGAGYWTELDIVNLLFMTTPGKVMAQRNAGNAILPFLIPGWLSLSHEKGACAANNEL